MALLLIGATELQGEEFGSTGLPLMHAATQEERVIIDGLLAGKAAQVLKALHSGDDLVGMNKSLLDFTFLQTVKAVTVVGVVLAAVTLTPLAVSPAESRHIVAVHGPTWTAP